ncbi:hypothetical protein LIER_33460 [Lithospermum erythrorhizon]|uniref:Uncharacterized protein n=1 Tax=Lithospermum erythrorhizon TaxID=34254 RepID=A0AAV3RY71_LITER
MKSSQNPISFHLLSNHPPSSNEDDDFPDLDNAMEALLKGVPMNFSAYSNQNNSQLGFGEFGNGHSLLNLKFDKKWSCWGSLVSQKQQQTTHLEDDKSSLPPHVDTCAPADQSVA